ncbi:MAG TPA: peptidylprolyl isomerase [Candidatus Nanoarchaeia archaeon]|nr:peptidylprolyl isomerase [Candidatus Nanoarchaeia archaeon]
MEETKSSDTINMEAPKKKTKVRWGRLSIVVIIIALIVLFVPFLKGESLFTGYIVKNIKMGSGNEIAATVNGEQITNKEIDEQYAKLPAQYQGLIDRETFVNQTILSKLLIQESIKEGITITDQEIDKSLDPLRINNETLEQIAIQQGYTVEELKKILGDRLYINKLLEKKLNIVITNEEAKKFFDENKADLEEKEQIKASHILVKTEEEATDIEKQLKEGKQFTELANQYSIDPGSNKTGGELGFFPKGVMVKEFEDAAFKLNINEVSNPVQTQFGYHIIKVTDKKPAKEANYDELKDKIKDYLKQQRLTEESKTYVEDLYNKNKDNIKIFPTKN